MEYADFVKQLYTDARSFALADYCTQIDQQRFDITPFDVAGDWTRKDKRKRL